MTKKQVLFSIRQRVDWARGVDEREMSKVTESSDIYEYFKGRIDAFDFIFDFLCDYD